MKKLRSHLFITLSILLASIAAYSFEPSINGKKLIQFQWAMPNTAFLQENTDKIENMPFDGVVFMITLSKLPMTYGYHVQEGDSLSHSTFGSYTFSEEDYSHAVQNLKETSFGRFTDNFILLSMSPGFNWTDENAWHIALHNASRLARIARESGCAGLAIEPRKYDKRFRLWDYFAQPDEFTDKMAYSAFPDFIKEKGQDFVRIINKEFPDIKLLLLDGPSVVNDPAWRHEMETWPAFVEGLCSAAADDTTIIDGNRYNFGNRFGSQFASDRKNALEARSLFENQKFYKRIQIAASAQLDYRSEERYGWYPNDIIRNFYMPLTWQNAVFYSLAFCDEYSWIYSRYADWWHHGAMETEGEEYMQATREGRSEPAYEGEDFLSFEIDQPAWVWVAYDSRGVKEGGGKPPGWLTDDFEQTELTLPVSDVGTGHFVLFRSRDPLPAGQVNLGGNADPPAKGFGSNYVVLLEPREGNDLNISNIQVVSGEPYEVAGYAESGVAYYIDRNAVLETVPEELEGALLIRTANDDKHIAVAE
jgi:hypothetical protein